MSAFDEMHYRVLRNRSTGYVAVTCLELLTHLYATYGNIIPDVLARNDNRLKVLYDVSFPIETMYDQVEGAIGYAVASGTPYSPEQVISVAHKLIDQTKALPDTYKEW